MFFSISARFLSFSSFPTAGRAATVFLLPPSQHSRSRAHPRSHARDLSLPCLFLFSIARSVPPVCSSFRISALCPSCPLSLSHSRAPSLPSAGRFAFTHSVPPVRSLVSHSRNPSLPSALSRIIYLCRSLALPPSHSLSPSLPLLSHRRILSLRPSLALTPSHSLSPSLPCSPTVALSLLVSPHALSPTNSLSLSLPRSHTVTFFLSFPPMQPPSHSLFPSLHPSHCPLSSSLTLTPGKERVRFPSWKPVVSDWFSAAGVFPDEACGLRV
ncbi:unnamed protein product [Closterium sp. NIES-65]|nr:unnamed protein product [Closterium sp. NIES-65]